MPYWPTSSRGTSSNAITAAACSLAIAARHPPHDVALGVHADDRVAERDDERLVADERPRARDGVAEAEQLAAGACRNTAPSRARTRARRAVPPCRSRAASAISSALRSKWFSIEALPGPVTNSTRVHADAGQLLDDVLHDRLAADGQHLLRLRFGGRQQPRAQAGDRHDGDVDGGPWATAILQRKRERGQVRPRSGPNPD